jgi:hypothetical protein
MDGAVPLDDLARAAVAPPAVDQAQPVVFKEGAITVEAGRSTGVNFERDKDGRVIGTTPKPEPTPAARRVGFKPEVR